jgi:hypothetical protein
MQPGFVLSHGCRASCTNSAQLGPEAYPMPLLLVTLTPGIRPCARCHRYMYLCERGCGSKRSLRATNYASTCICLSIMSPCITLQFGARACLYRGSLGKAGDLSGEVDQYRIATPSKIPVPNLVVPSGDCPPIANNSMQPVSLPTI